MPVLARYHARLLAAARFAGTGLICGGADPGRRNITNPLISALDGGSGLPRLDTSRLRATWLADCAELLGLATFMHAAGISCSQRLGDLVAGLEPAGEAEAVRLLGAARRMIALAAFEEIIDASGVAPRIEAMLPDRGARPAAEGPHPAGGHVPGPGRRPARAPDPRAPGADQPAAKMTSGGWA